jgi:hypothetical protein
MVCVPYLFLHDALRWELGRQRTKCSRREGMRPYRVSISCGLPVTGQDGSGLIAPKSQVKAAMLSDFLQHIVVLVAGDRA